MEEIKNKMRRAAINNYKRKSEEKTVNIEEFLKNALNELESEDGNGYFMTKTYQFDNVGIDKTLITSMKSILSNICPGAIIINSWSVGNAFSICVPTDEKVDEMIKKYENDPEQLSEWKKIKLE
jgi:hypothetical protein